MLRALVVDDLTPNADRDAGSLALLSHMLAMQGLGYAVSFAAAQGVPPESRDAAVLERQGITVYRAPYYASVEEVLRRQAHCFDVIYLHRVSTASAYFSLARQHHPRARIVYSVADLHHVRVARQAALEQRPELMAESRRLRLLECTAAWSADAVITHSTMEAELLRQAVPGANVHVVPWAMPVQPTTVPLAARRGVAFIGGFAHTPNCDAARYLAETIMPLVWQTHPEIEALLAGSAMPGAIAALARPGIAVLGAVPNLSDVFDRVRLTVAPLRYGAGVKGKVLSSFAAGIPCVMTPTAAEGIALPQPLDHLVATDAAAFAAIIIQLHAGQTPYRAASAAGLSLIETGFNAARVSEALGAAIEGRGQAMQLAATG
jgi:glycosyltransferase involved in cell wall biosynthesis